MIKTRQLLLLFHRNIHLGGACKSAEKSNLAKLRKKTGFSFVNCKKALKEFNNDLIKAEEWLHQQAKKEGWSKATRLQGRETAQGLVAVLCQDNYATMIEVNCETDFVARNSHFHEFVGKVASMALKQHRNQNSAITEVGKVELTSERLNELKNEKENSTVKDITALAIGKIGENITVNRAVCMHVPLGYILGNYVHSMAQTSVFGSNDCSLGKYGALVALNTTKEPSPKSQPTSLARRLCQHIVGMKPLSIGEFIPPVRETEQEESKDEQNSEEEIVTELLNQEYLIEPSVTVGELLYQEGMEVNDFIRYECGQKSEAQS